MASMHLESPHGVAKILEMVAVIRCSFQRGEPSLYIIVRSCWIMSDDFFETPKDDDKILNGKITTAPGRNPKKQKRREN